MNRSLALSVLVVSLLASSFFAYRWRKADIQLRENMRWMHAAVDSLAATVSVPNRLSTALLDEADIARLKGEGLKDPMGQLREGLMARADIIPYPGVLGGTMGFEEDSIVLLKSPYAFAGFDDGHEQGSLLVEYSVKPGGQIEWKRLWAELE